MRVPALSAKSHLVDDDRALWTEPARTDSRRCFRSTGTTDPATHRWRVLGGRPELVLDRQGDDGRPVVAGSISCES